MEIRKPGYFDAFRCIAGRCPDSCCKEWDVQVDAESAAFYRELPGPLGDDLRQVLKEEDGETVMTIVNGRCPMWREDGLCRIQAELGEGALCHVCAQFPRLTHDYGDFVELGLELSCPEAARILLNTPETAWVSERNNEEREPEYDSEAMESLLHSRQTALRILREADTPSEALAQLLLFGIQAQEELDGAEPEEFLTENAMEIGKELGKNLDFRILPQFFAELEILTDTWRQRLNQAHSVPLPEQTRALGRYLVERYWLQAVADYDLVCRVKFIVAACLLVGSLGGDFCQTAQLFSKEIENDAENVDAILDAAYTNPAFTDEALLGWLLKAFS